MTVNLDIFELGYLLDSCLRGSHLRSGTTTRFVNEWYNLLTEWRKYKQPNVDYDTNIIE